MTNRKISSLRALFSLLLTCALLLGLALPALAATVELVKNGTFNTDLSQWTNVGGFWSRSAGGLANGTNGALMYQCINITSYPAGTATYVASATPIIGVNTEVWVEFFDGADCVDSVNGSGHGNGFATYVLDSVTPSINSIFPGGNEASIMVAAVCGGVSCTVDNISLSGADPTAVSLLSFQSAHGLPAWLLPAAFCALLLGGALLAFRRLRRAA